jgi:hypothetical protein
MINCTYVEGSANTCFKVPQKNSCQESLCPDQDSDWEFPKYMSEFGFFSCKVMLGDLTIFSTTPQRFLHMPVGETVTILWSWILLTFSIQILHSACVPGGHMASCYGRSWHWVAPHIRQCQVLRSCSSCFAVDTEWRSHPAVLLKCNNQIRYCMI